MAYASTPGCLQRPRALNADAGAPLSYSLSSPRPARAQPQSRYSSFTDALMPIRRLSPACMGSQGMQQGDTLQRQALLTVITVQVNAVLICPLGTQKDGRTCARSMHACRQRDKEGDNTGEV